MPSPWFLGDLLPAPIEQKAITFGGGNTPTNMGDAWLRGVYDFLGTGADVERWAQKAGDLIDNSAVMACIRWKSQRLAEAPVQVKIQGQKGKKEVVEGHALPGLLRRPNPYYGGRTLLRALGTSFGLTGNAYALKGRNNDGKGLVKQLWFEPHYSIRPMGNQSEFISHYEIYRNGRWERIEKEQVVHLRDGIDPRNPRLGLNYLAAAMRFVFTDNEAALYTATMLHNLGVPPVMISPKTGEVITNPEDVKTLFMSKTQGDQRGEPLVWGDPVDVQMLAFDPKNMNLRELVKLDEERISALTGVPAIVANLGAGLERSTFSNMAEAREMAYEDGVIPTLGLWAEGFELQLLSDVGNPDREEVEFDLSDVRVLQEDENKRWARYLDALNRGAMMLAEVRSEMNLEALQGDAGKMWFIPSTVQVVSDLAAIDVAVMPEPEPTPSPPDTEAGPKEEDDTEEPPTNGNGSGSEKVLGLPVLASGGGVAVLTKAEPSKRVEAIAAKMERAMSAKLEQAYGSIASHVGG